MGKSWSGLKKELEEDFLCDSLKGRVKYFMTHYHKAPDQYGRIAIRVDGKEVIRGNPYSFYNNYLDLENEIKNELEIPWREWTRKETLYDEENTAVEERVKDIAIDDGIFEIYFITDAIIEYKNQAIDKSINSENPIIRMFAVMDRRVGKRTSLKLAEVIEKQPSWLQFFYKLRLESEGII